jgi:DNA replication protein DnaC
MARPDCPECGGTGWKLMERESREAAAASAGAAPESAVETDGGEPLLRSGKPAPFGPFANLVAARCECSQGDRAARVLEAARIPQRYQHCDFDNYDIDLYENEADAPAWNRSLKQAKLLAQGFARDFPVGADHGLLVMGPCGVGKTHLAVAALQEIVQRGHRGLFYDYRELLKEIQASYNPENPASEMDVLEPVLTAEVLLLDDLGASKPSAWALETVGHILNVRYNENRTTLLTTNYLDGPAVVREGAGGGTAAAPALAREDSLADRVGQRIRSRLYEMCRTVEIVAPDYRKRIRQAWHLRT